MAWLSRTLAGSKNLVDSRLLAGVSQAALRGAGFPAPRVEPGV